MFEPHAVLIDPQIYDCLNMGGMAMVSGLVARLRARWPEARLMALTEAPATLARLLPDVQPVPHAHLLQWTAERFLLGAVLRRMPYRLSRRVLQVQGHAEQRYPRLSWAATRARVRFTSARADFDIYLRAIAEADLIVVSGSSGPSDAFPASLRATLVSLQLAAASGTPTLMVSQGAGAPIAPGTLLDRTRHILPRVDVVLVRERCAAAQRFADLGVPRERILFGGDDAFDAAHAARPGRLGDRLGVNLRVAAYTGVGPAVLEETRQTLQTFARATGVRLEPVPIALHERSPDHEAIRLLLAGLDDASDGGRTLDTPEAATRAAGRCRVVVTGAYHSAVFALAQGVPVVAVVGSELYGDKFRGLEEQFGDAVRLVPVAEAAFGARLLDAVQATWHAADALHPRTIGAVRGIVELNRAAYAQAFDRVTAGVGVR